MDVKSTSTRGSDTGPFAPDNQSNRVLHSKKITESQSFVYKALAQLRVLGGPATDSQTTLSFVTRPTLIATSPKNSDPQVLLTAVRNKDIATLGHLLQTGSVDIHYRDPATGDTAWGLAVRAGDQGMIDLLKPALHTRPSPIALTSSKRSHDSQQRRATGSQEPVDTPPGHRAADAFEAIEAGDRTALQRWLSTNKANVGNPHPNTHLTPLLQALMLKRSDMVADLEAAGANPTGIDLKSANAIRDLALSSVPAEYRSHEGMLRAAQEGKYQICTNLQLSGILESTTISNLHPPITTEVVEQNSFFHKMYRRDLDQTLLPDSGMYLFRESSQGGFAITYRNAKKDIISTQFSCRDNKIVVESRGKKQWYNTFDEFVGAILPFTKSPIGIESPWTKLNALDEKYKCKGGLLKAVDDHNTDAIETLIMCGAGEYEVNGVAANGKTPLTLAIEKGQKVLVRRLVNAGADPEAMDTDQNTPMHIAAKNNDLETINFLSLHDASMQTVNRAGLTPLQLATTAEAINRLTPASHDEVEEGEAAD